MKRLIAIVVGAAFAMGAAFAQAPAVPVAPVAPVATPVHKKAAASAKHKKVTVRKERIKKL